MHKMDQVGFRSYLKRAGKKDQVIEGLVRQVQAFEDYLGGERHTELEAATPQDIQTYVDTLAPQESKERLRGLALYYHFAGNQPLARLASDLRERRIAKARQAFRLRDLRGVRTEDAQRLEALGIVNVELMVEAGESARARQQLAQRSGVSPEVILELVKLSDLSRIFGIKGVRARLYYDAGLDTPDKLASSEPEALRQMLVEYVQRAGFDGVAPLPREIAFTIAAARGMPQVVEY